MSDSHEVVFSSLAILMGKHQGLELTDEQMFLLLNIEAGFPEILAEAIKTRIVLPAPEAIKFLEAKILPSLEVADEAVGANGDILKLLIALFEKLLPMILPLFVKAEK